MGEFKLSDSKYLFRNINRKQELFIANNGLLVPKRLNIDTSIETHIGKGSSYDTNMISFTGRAHVAVKWQQQMNEKADYRQFKRSAIILINKNNVNDNFLKQDKNRLKGCTARNFGSSSYEEVYSGVLDRKYIRILDNFLALVIDALEVTDIGAGIRYTNKFADVRETILDKVYQNGSVEVLNCLEQLSYGIDRIQYEKLLSYCGTEPSSAMSYNDYFSIQKHIWQMFNGEKLFKSDVRIKDLTVFKKLAEKQYKYMQLYGLDKEHTFYINDKDPQYKTVLWSVLYNLESYTIPDNVRVIGSYAFRGCNKVTELYIPDSVRRFENYAFAKCDSLQSISVKSLTELELHYVKRTLENSNIQFIHSRDTDETYCRTDLLKMGYILNNIQC